MPNTIAKLKAAHARLDGLMLAPDGTVDFAATNASGAWTEAQKSAVRAALGLGAPVSAPAQGLGYNNFVTAVSYASSSVALWQRQAMALAAWRDAVWRAAVPLLAEPARLPENDDALIAALPQPEIPLS